jgi:hypothetical protein
VPTYRKEAGQCRQQAPTFPRILHPWPEKRFLVTIQGEARPVARAELDGRSVGAKAYDRLVSAITTDLGGADAISTERTLIATYAGITARAEELIYLKLVGEPSDLVACASRIQQDEDREPVGPERAAEGSERALAARVPRTKAEREAEQADMSGSLRQPLGEPLDEQEIEP